ncbi:MAG: hypothetical protein KGO82_09140, partial [Bacteroidota bacterium]|nr:hypothetical protein [Bacteroidota bacterium]
MQFKKTVLSCSIFIVPVVLLAQSSYLPQGAKESWLLNRLDIKLGHDSNFSFSSTHPLSRKAMVNGIESIYHLNTGALSDSLPAGLFTPVDTYNM